MDSNDAKYKIKENTMRGFVIPVKAICENYESKQDWQKFVKFVNIVLSETPYAYEWAAVIKSNIKNSQWLEKYTVRISNLSNSPHFKLSKDMVNANDLVKQKRYDEALKIYQSLSSKCEDENEKLNFEFKICKCLFDSDQYEKACPIFEEFIIKNKKKDDSKVIKVMLMKGQSHIKLNELNKALETFFSIMAEFPDNKETPKVNFFVGYCYMLQEKHEKAKQAFDAISKLYPNSPYAAKAEMYITRINSITNTIVN